MFIKQIAGAVFVDKILSVLESALPGNLTFALQIGTNISNLSIGTQQSAPADIRKQATIKDSLPLLNENPFVVCTSMSLMGPQNQQVLAYTVTSPDQIIGYFSLPGGERAWQIALLRELRRHFSLFDKASLIATLQTDGISDGLREREVAIATLENQFTKLKDFTERLAISERETRLKLQEELEHSYKERRDTLELEYQTQRAALDNHKRETDAAAQERELDFKRRQDAFETRESKFVRRDLLKRIEEVLSKNQGPLLSDATIEKRKPIHYILLSLTSVALVAFALVFYRVLSAQTFDWHLLLPLTATFSLVVTTLIYYARWMDKWFREHADVEFVSARYKADMLRASWVAELVSEMRQLGTSENTEVPTALLEALTRHLFVPQVDTPSEHPLEQVTGLLRRASEIKVSKDGLEIKSKT